MLLKSDLLTTSVASHQVYQLDYEVGEAQTPDELQTRQFVLWDEADEACRREFDTFEQVMNFVLDELLRPAHPDEALCLEDWTDGSRR